MLRQMERLLVSLLKTPHYGATGQMTEQGNIIHLKQNQNQMVYIVWMNI